MNDNILKTLKKDIKESKIPISVIAKKSDISRQYIYKILNDKGKSITIDTLQRIYNVLNKKTPFLNKTQIINKQDLELQELSAKLNEIEKAKVIGYAKARLEEQQNKKKKQNLKINNLTNFD